MVLVTAAQSSAAFTSIGSLAFIKTATPEASFGSRTRSRRVRSAAASRSSPATSR
jgi:hypothetical protein